jgi:hypothetical protein
VLLGEDAVEAGLHVQDGVVAQRIGVVRPHRAVALQTSQSFQMVLKNQLIA